jgi:transposase
VVALVGDKLDLARQRVQHDTLGHRGRSGDPLYAARRILRSGEGLLTDKQQIRLAGLFADEEHLPVEVGWCVYQDVIAAYRNPDKTSGKAAMTRIIDSLRHGVPTGLDELAQLGRTLHRRRHDILAWFTHPGSSNGPTEAINGRLEHLRAIALGFRNLTNYRIRSLPRSRRVQTPDPTLFCEEPQNHQKRPQGGQYSTGTKGSIFARRERGG